MKKALEKSIEKTDAELKDEPSVKLPKSLYPTDGDIAANAAHQLELSTIVPTGEVTATVSNGWITLEGEVEWKYMKTAAENVVHHLSGVKGVSNLVSIKPKLIPTDIKTFLQVVLGSTIVLVGMATIRPAIATAPMPPNLHPATLNGKSIYVLYMTRSDDKVLVRCYPGQQPGLVVMAKPGGTKEGTLACGN